MIILRAENYRENYLGPGAAIQDGAAMTTSAYFAADYQEARGKFLDAAKSAGMAVTSHPHPGKGPDGGALAMDVAVAGDASCPNALICTSATHGVEGFCGSGAMVGLMREGVVAERPADTAVVLVHAHNPHGFAHLRRTNEDNIDLNRNFVDHTGGHPANRDYAEVHPWLVPADWDGPARDAADTAIAGYIAAHGEGDYQKVVSMGQYSHADGLFYGGVAPSWSNKTWRAVLREHGADRQRLCVIDYHTGLGPRGYGEIQFERGPEDPEFLRAQRWYNGEVTSPEDGTSSSAAVTGYMAVAAIDEAPKPERTCIAIEYGTLPWETVLASVRADNWLYAKGEVNSPLGRDIKRAIRDAFYGDDDQWKADVYNRAAEVTRWSYAGLTGG